MIVKFSDIGEMGTSCMKHLQHYVFMYPDGQMGEIKYSQARVPERLHGLMSYLRWQEGGWRKLSTCAASILGTPQDNLPSVFY